MIQVPQQHIPIKGSKDKGPRRDTLAVHDTVYRTRTETLTVYVPPIERMPFDSFFVHDTIHDTTSHLAIVPLPIPWTVRRYIDCPPSAPPSSATVTPEPSSFLLILTVCVIFGAIYLWRNRKP